MSLLLSRLMKKRGMSLLSIRKLILLDAGGAETGDLTGLGTTDKISPNLKPDMDL
jgi:hypothetical protein